MRAQRSASTSDTPLESLCRVDSFLTSEEIEAGREDIATGFEGEWLWSEVSARLRRGVFHVTGVEGWAGIKKNGSILPNDSKREPMFEKSARCRGWKVGGVCLFDFETPCIELVARQWDWAARHIVRHPGRPMLSEEESHAEIVRGFCDPDYRGTPDRPVALIQFGDRGALPGPWEYWREVRPCVDDCVPYVECWHKAPMPLQVATSVHVFRWGAEEAERWRSYDMGDALGIELE